MTLAPTLYLTLHLIIAEYMPCLLASNNKGPHLPTNINENIQKTAAKQLPSYYNTIKVPNVSDSLIFYLSIVDIRSCKSKCMTRNKDGLITTMSVATKKQNDSNPLISVALIESIRSRKSKRANTENDDNKWDRTSICIHTIGHQYLQKNSKIVTKNDSNKSEKNEINDITDKDTKEKK